MRKILAALLLAAASASAQTAEQTVIPSFTEGPVPLVNEGCSPFGSLLVCPMLSGTHVYAAPSGKQNVWINNYGNARALTRVQTVTFRGTLSWFTEESVYLDWLGTCEAEPGHCSGSNLPADRCPCQKDGDPGPLVRPVGAIGNLSIDARTRGLYPDLTWGPDGVTVPTFSFIVIGDKEHGSPGVMYAVTVEDRPGADYVFRLPKVDHVVMCNGSAQVNAFEPWQMAEDLTITGAQIYAVGGNGPTDNLTRVTYACFYIYDTLQQPPVWRNCGIKETATTGYYAFTKEIKAGQYLVWHAANVCTPGYAWDGVASITAKKRSGAHFSQTSPEHQLYEQNLLQEWKELYGEQWERLKSEGSTK